MTRFLLALSLLLLAGYPAQAEQSVAELNDLGVAAYKKKNYQEAERVLRSALDKANKDNQERLEVLNNLWVTYIRLNDDTNASKMKSEFDKLNQRLEQPPDIEFSSVDDRSRKIKGPIQVQVQAQLQDDSAGKGDFKPVAARRELSVSGLSLLFKGGKYYVEGLLINRTRKRLRSVTVDMELTLDDATEEFETIFLKGIGPETSKSFEKGIEIESKTAKPVMATVIKINSLDFESFDMYKPMRKSK
ncbi:hypothetical protein GC174_18610 [bacterium]|nr:hypothetical protein [bacterium]